MTPRALFHPARLARRPVLSTQSDERLVDLVRAGSDPAFEAIVERYRRALMRYVSRLLPPERAEDVVQQAFVKAYEAMHRNSAELNLKSWLYRIAHNGALNALRDRGWGHAELSDTIDGVERPDQALERNLGLRELLVAVQALPERQRSAILLRELEGRSYDEIAVALGVSDGAVRQLLNRARNTLRSAAATVIPMPLVERVAASASTEPIAELVGVGGGAFALKLCATALVTGAVVGGAAVVPDIGTDPSNPKRGGIEAAQAAEDDADSKSESSEGGDDESGGSRTGSRSHERGSFRSRRAERREARRRRSGDRDSSGPGSGDRERSGDRDGDDNSGPGGGDDGQSGPGGGGELDGESGHSGPGGGGGDRSGSGDGTSGGDLTDDNSGPGGGGTSGSDDDPIDQPADVNDTDGSSGSGSSGNGSGELSLPDSGDSSGSG